MKSQAYLLILFLIGVIFLIGCQNDITPLGCTKEAKLCPDGSSVAPNPDNNCEFDPCPDIIPQGCTEEAKICPDGSSVGRNPDLNCRFDPCPDKIDNDQKYCETDEDCEIKYNIRYNNQCSAGCFNKYAEVDEWCNENMKWELIIEDCSCVNNICELNVEVKDLPTENSEYMLTILNSEREKSIEIEVLNEDGIILSPMVVPSKKIYYNLIEGQDVSNPVVKDIKVTIPNKEQTLTINEKREGTSMVFNFKPDSGKFIVISYKAGKLSAIQSTEAVLIA